jgi:hypothetical protein
MRTQILSLLCVWLAASAAHAQDVLKAPQLSPAATTSQTIGLTEISVSYHRPAVNRRVIWGEVVPYGEIWRTGANENATIRVSSPVRIEGKPLAAGTYGLYMIPGESRWTIIFSTMSVAWGAYSYDPKEDALRVTVKPQKTADVVERMRFDVDDLTDRRATFALRWERVRVPFAIEIDTPAVVMASMRAELRGLPRFYWPGWAQAADYWLHHGGSLDEAQRMAEHALSLKENFITAITAAAVAEKRGDARRAAQLRERAFAIGSEQEVNEQAAALLDVKRIDEALALFKRNTEIHPSSSDAFEGIGDAYRDKGDRAAAVTAYEKALALTHDDRSRAQLRKALERLR